ncbi:MAG: pyridoxal phosphate-dependent aminotransferase [Anaerolineales bacterium]|nr:pyridoxal phosphate-dependent aminotransferase [Anaerolineales bacterium]
MNFDHVIDRRNTKSEKWDTFGDALPLWVADMDFTAPEPILAALHQRVEHGIFGYTTPQAELKEAIQAWLLKRHNWHVDEAAIVFTPGVMRGINMVGRAVGNPGDGILIQPPVYPHFFEVPQNCRRELQLAEIPHTSGGNYEIDFDLFERAIDKQTRLFILCNPHNPIGHVFTTGELMKLGEICLLHGITICSDEIHRDLVFSGHRHVPIATLSPELAACTVTMIAPSKTFNIPGLYCSVMIIENETLREQVLAAGAGLIHGSNLMGYLAALAAYQNQDCEVWLDDLLVYLESNRDYVADFVQQRLPGVSMTKPDATYLAWLDCHQAGLGSNPQTFFLTHANVAVNDGAQFGQVGAGFVRLNFGCPRSTLVTALERMERALSCALA